MARKNLLIMIFPVIILSLIALSACGKSGGGGGGPSTGTLTGFVYYDGKNPISGAIVKVWEVGGTSYSVSNGTQVRTISNAIALGATTSGTDGSYTISYTQPPNGTVLYVTATGGITTNGSNPFIYLISVIGESGSLPSSSTPIVLNELTTVATVHSFYNFFANGNTQTSFTGSIQNGLPTTYPTALLTLQQLINIPAGTINSSTYDAKTLEAHANVLTLCIEDSSNCQDEDNILGLNGYSISSTANTAVSTTLNIAYAIHSATQTELEQLSTLLVSANNPLPYSSALSMTAPLVAIQVNVNGHQNSVAADGSGNIWASSSSNFIAGVGNYSAHSSLPGYIYSTNVSAPLGLAVDSSGNIWVANSGSNSVTEFVSGGNPDKPNTYCNTGTTGCTTTAGFNFSAPEGVAVDGSGNVWVTNTGNNSVTEILASTPGTPSVFCNTGATGCTTTAGFNLNAPVGVAVDGSGNVWVTNTGNNSVTEILASTPATPSVYCNTGATGCTSTNAFNFNVPTGVAVDNSGNLWISNVYEVTEIPSSNPSKPIVFAQNLYGFNAANGNGHGMNSIAVDGAGNIWVTNYGTSSVTEIPSSDSSAPAVFQSPTVYPFSSPVGLAIDGAGNVWVANQGSNNMTEIIGAATGPTDPIVAQKR